jgi:multidrug resistance efflux pump
MEKQQDCEIEQAEADIGKAKAEVQDALAELEHAERDLEKAGAELEEAERHKPRIVEVTVDRQRKCVEAGVYVVSAFKALVGVAADRELDILKDGVLEALDENAKITIHGCETFVSHARTGGSS